VDLKSSRFCIQVRINQPFWVLHSYPSTYNIFPLLFDIEIAVFLSLTTAAGHDGGIEMGRVIVGDGIGCVQAGLLKCGI
jgi:hypothetical protein